MPERFRQIQYHLILGQYEQVVYDEPEGAGYTSIQDSAEFALNKTSAFLSEIQ